MDSKLQQQIYQYAETLPAERKALLEMANPEMLYSLYIEDLSKYGTKEQKEYANKILPSLKQADKKEVVKSDNKTAKTSSTWNVWNDKTKIVGAQNSSPSILTGPVKNETEFSSKTSYAKTLPPDVQKSIKTELQKKAKELENQLKEAKDKNGFIGSSWDWVKNTTTLGAGSDKTQKEIDDLNKQLQDLDKNPKNLDKVYKNITGTDLNKAELEKFQKGEINLKATESLNGYKEGQEMAVDVTSDLASGVAAVGIYTAAVAAAPFTGGASIAAGVLAAGAAGAAIKTGIKYADAKSGGREYDSLGYDLATGAFSGVLAPVTGGVGGAAGKTIATKLGVQAVKQVGKEIVEETVETGIKQGIKTVLTNPTGYEYVGGTFLKRSIATGTEMAVDGATGGSVDNIFRASLNGDNIVDAGVQGFVGGLVLSPVIGGGIKSSGKITSKLFKSADDGVNVAKSGESNFIAENFPNMQTKLVDEKFNRKEMGGLTWAKSLEKEAKSAPVQAEVKGCLDALLHDIPKTEGNIDIKTFSFIQEKWCELPSGEAISVRATSNNPIIPDEFGFPTGQSRTNGENIVFQMIDKEGNPHLLPVYSKENMQKAMELLKYMKNAPETNYLEAVAKGKANSVNPHASIISKTSPLIKVAEHDIKLKEYSSILDKEGNLQFDDALDEMRSIFPERLRNSIGGRTKGATSIYDKLDRKITKLTAEITKLQKSADALTPENQAEINKLIIKKDNLLNDISGSRSAVGDLIGTRMVLDDANPEAIDEVVESLAKSIENGEITITEINNYRGKYGKAYFSDSNIERLQTAAHGKCKITFLTGAEEIKGSGYTTAQMNIVHRNGALGEFQIRGKHINELAEFEHIPYDLRQGKDLSKGIKELGELLEPVKIEAKSLSKDDYSKYEDYLSRCYEYSRNLEMGLPANKPEFPSFLNKILSVESLESLHKKAEEIKKSHK